MASVKSVTIETGDIEKLLKDLPAMMRGQALASAVRKAGDVVRTKARELVPVGDPSHKPDNQSLKSTIAVKVERYKNDTVYVAVVGPRRPTGSHGHLVEEGHRVRARGKKGEGPGDFTGATVPGKKFMAPATDKTKDEQMRAIVDHFKSVVEKNRVG